MDPIILCLCFFIGFIILLSIYLWMDEYFALRQTLGFITGPKNYPFIGLSWQMSRIPRKDRFQWFNDLCFSFKNGMVMTWFGIEPIVNVRKPRHLEIILPSYAYIRKTRMFKLLTPWLGSGLLTATGEQWYNHKRLVSHSFHHNVLEDYMANLQQNTNVLIKRIDETLNENPKKPINIFEIVEKYCLSTAIKNSMGMDIDMQYEISNSYVQTLSNFCRIPTDRFFKFWTKSNCLFFYTRTGKQFLNAIKMMHDFTEKVIQRKREERKNTDLEKPQGKESSEQSIPKSFLDYLLDANEQSDNPLTDQEIRQEVDTFQFMEISATSVAISWALFTIGNAPKVQEKIHAELLKVLRTSDEPVNMKQLERLEYLDRVIKEILRLYPSVASIGRCLENDVVIDNCFIPRETIINIQIYQLHHDPEIWRDPETFDPDRFLPENCKERHEYAYIPFSSGPRTCIGKNLGLLEIKLVLLSILRKWWISSVLKPNKIKLVSDFVLRPYNDKIDLYFHRIDNINTSHHK